MEAKSILVKCFLEKKGNFITFTYYDVTDVAKVLKLPDLNANVFISFMLQELNALKTFAISLVPDARWRYHVTDW